MSAKRRKHGPDPQFRGPQQRDTSVRFELSQDSGMDEMKCYPAFQSIDIRESISTSNNSEIHLFGATKVSLVAPLVQKYYSYRHQSGHSILVRVLDFEHYFYYPAPPGLSADDMGPIRDYLNVGRAVIPIFCLSQTNLF